MEDIQSEKRKFAEQEIMLLVFQGALGRGHVVYNKNVDEAKKKDFRSYLSERIIGFANNFNGDETAYLKMLIEFQNDINSKFQNILNNRKISFGRVQKLLNLCFKYYWAFDFNKSEPLHCPIDAVILGKLGWVTPQPSWTSSEFKENEYAKAMEKSRKVAAANKMSIAEWELRTFRESPDKTK